MEWNGAKPNVWVHSISIIIVNINKVHCVLHNKCPQLIWFAHKVHTFQSNILVEFVLLSMAECAFFSQYFSRIIKISRYQFNWIHSFIHWISAEFEWNPLFAVFIHGIDGYVICTYERLRLKSGCIEGKTKKPMHVEIAVVTYALCAIYLYLSSDFRLVFILVQF